MKRADFFKKTLLGAVAIWKAPEILAAKPKLKKVTREDFEKVWPHYNRFRVGDIVLCKEYDSMYIVADKYKDRGTPMVQLVYLDNVTRGMRIPESAVEDTFSKIGHALGETQHEILVDAKLIQHHYQLNRLFIQHHYQLNRLFI